MLLFDNIALDNMQVKKKKMLPPDCELHKAKNNILSFLESQCLDL